jgi:hypothetical protein
MTQPDANVRVSCLSLAILVLVAGLMAAALALGFLGPRAGSWTTIAAVTLAGVAVFMIERGLHNLFWGVVAAAALAAHPLVRQTGREPEDLLAQAAALAGLAAVAVGWRLAFQRVFAWRLWPLTAAALAASVGLTWSADPALGLVVGFLGGLSLLPAPVLARRRRLRVDLPSPPSRLNVMTALGVSLLAPVAGVYLSQWLALAGEPRPWHSLGEAWQAYLDRPVKGWDQLNDWCWPTAWLIMPLLAWAWWRSCKRGWRAWRTGQTPAAWLLTVLMPAAAIALVPRAELAPLTLMGISVVMLVFWLADVWKGTLEQLILLPPETERPPVRATAVSDAGSTPARS